MVYFNKKKRKGLKEMDEKKRIGLFIKQKRKLLGLTQEELTQKVGYKTRSSVNKIEHGLSEIPPNKLKIFAEVLQCDITDLIPKATFSDIPKENLYTTTVYAGPPEKEAYTIEIPFIPLPQINNIELSQAVDVCKNCYNKEKKVFESKIIDLQAEYDKIKYAYTSALKMVQQIDTLDDLKKTREFLTDLQNTNIIDLQQLNALRAKYNL